MTDCDCRGEGITTSNATTTTTAATVLQDEGQDMMRFDAPADTVAHGDNGPIRKAVVGEAPADSAHSPPPSTASWTLTTARDSVQLSIEPRNGYVCFIGLDAASCELVLRPSHGDSSIDGRQAVLVFANGAFHIKDLNSSYGTYINERRVPSRCFVQLDENDHVRFGFSADVYRLQRITTSTGISSSATTSITTANSTVAFPSSAFFPDAQSALVKARSCELDPGAITVVTSSTNTSTGAVAGKSSSGPMNKLLRLKGRKSEKTKSKEDVLLNGKGSASGAATTATASSKLSPSTSSLMSSASSNSSSSSSATTPSSVFMSAMKKMRYHFKRKSSKDKSMVCSANDDITFIRYDSQGDVAATGNTGALGRSVPHSVSAPQSPSQPHLRMFTRSHTYLDSCSERDLSPIISAQSTGVRGKVQQQQQQRSFFGEQFYGSAATGQTLTEVEHDYDEVTREEEPLAPLQPSLQPSFSGDKVMVEQESAEQCHLHLHHHRHSHPHQHLVQPDLEELHEADLEENEDGTTSTPDSVVRESENEEDDSFDEVLAANEEHIYGHTAFESVERVRSQENHFSTTTTATGDLQRPDSEFLEGLVDSSTCSSVVVLPHLNSEDRLNNNSSLDTLLTSSILIKPNCPVDYLEDSVEPDFQLLSASVDDEPSLSETESRPLEETEADLPTSESQGLPPKDSIVSSMIELSESPAGGLVCPPSSHYGSHHHHHQHHHRPEPCFSLADYNNKSTSRQHQLMSSDQALSNTANCDLQSNSLPLKRSSTVAAVSPTAANGSWSEEEEEEAESPKEANECEYDIDDIGHLRRHSHQQGTATNVSSTTVPCPPVSAGSEQQMMTDSRATTQSPVSMEIYWQYGSEEQHHQQPQESSPFREVNGECRVKNEEKKRAIGGMAFVINFDQDEEGQCTGTTVSSKAALSAGHHRRFQQNSTKASSTAPVTAEPVGGGRLARQSSWRRSRNVTTTTASPPTTTTATTETTANKRATVEVNNASDHGKVSVCNSVGRNRDSAAGAEDRNTKARLSATELSSSHSCGGVEGAAAADTREPLTGEVETAVRGSREDTVTRSASRNSSTGGGGGTMKKQSRASFGAADVRDKDGGLPILGTRTTTSNTSSRSSRSSSHNPRPGGGQLSESAVYLINRMFEDSDYHRYQCGKQQSTADGGEEQQHQQHQHEYGEHEHIYASLSSSPRSASPYSANQHHHHHHPHHQHQQQQQPNQHLHASSPYICNSSVCTASTRMEYDESLSSLHSTTNSDHHSGQRVRSSSGLPQSLATTVVSHQSSSPSSSQQSTLEKQVDSAIDEDGDLIADDDDISEAGTYTVEIDQIDGSKHRKKTPSEEDELTAAVEDSSVRREGHFEEDSCSTIAEPVVSATEDYEEDADCEVEDNEEEEEEEEEDQLEIARRKIDELFNVYSSQKSKESMEPIASGNNSTNNSTFTRPKRRSRTSALSTDEDEEETAATTSATSDECLPLSAHYEAAVKERSAFSKKRISTELMTALKKINSKLERTVKLGKMNSPPVEEPKKRGIPSAPLRYTNQSQTAAPKVGKTHSAPATPLLSENRKSFRYSKAIPTAAKPTAARVFSRKNSTVTSASSVDDFDDQSSALSTETYIQPVARGRSESVNSAASNNSSANSNTNSSMRFNRAFALRRARLGMDTCGVEISESAASKAKEAQAKASPKPKPQLAAFRRNDGGRFSLRAPSATAGASGTPRTRQPFMAKQSPVTTPSTRTSSTGPVKAKPSPASVAVPVSTVKSIPVKAPTKPRTGSYSASASVCSSSENIAGFSSKLTSPSPRTVRKLRSSTTAVSSAVSVPKAAHSDNEIILNDGESSCGEEPQPLFTRFGRSSLRSQPATSSTPWLQSLNASREVNYSKQRISTAVHPHQQQQPQQPSSVFSSSLQKSSSFSSNAPAAKNYHSSGRSAHNAFGLAESGDMCTQSEAVQPSECVRSIPSFQMGKRFFSTKPHQMAQFDRDFSAVARCSSAAANGHQANGQHQQQQHQHQPHSSGHSKKLTSDPNLMTHSATESLLSRHVLSTSPGASNAVADSLGSPRVDQPSTASASTTLTPPISSCGGINARIFSISPLDSLVISAINQLSFKLRTRMRDLLERERSNNSIGSETRVLIEEILPQVGPSAIGMDSRSGQPKNAYSHEPSNISRDLSNILKNLKKVEQIFEVFNMLLEPGMSVQEVPSDQVSVASSGTAHCNAIVTHASDSDSASDGLQSTTSHGHHSAYAAPSSSSTRMAVARTNAVVASAPVGQQQHSHRPAPANLSRFASQSPPESPPTNSRTSGGGFFIEI